MNAIVVIVGYVIAEQPAKVWFVQSNDMVQHLAPATSNPPFRGAILPGRLDACPLGLQTRRF